MALGHRRSWKIIVHGNISNLYVKLKATTVRPSGKFQRLLKLDKLLIGLDSKSGSRILVQQRSTFKSRLIGFVKKHFVRRRSKTKTSFGFKMPDPSCSSFPYLVVETEHQSWHLGRVELSFVAAFGVGLANLLAEFCIPTLKVNRNFCINPIPSLSSFILACLLLFVLWLHKPKFLSAMLITVASLLLLQMDRFLEHLNLGLFS